MTYKEFVLSVFETHEDINTLTTGFGLLEAPRFEVKQAPSTEDILQRNAYEFFRTLPQ